MSSASAQPRGFVAVRGRGYRPDQVDAYGEALSRHRDAAWERAARLTVLAKDMEADAQRLREAVAGLAPQTYEALGEGAQRLFQLGEEEAAAVRESARCAARDEIAQAEAHAEDVLQAARDHADAVRAEAEERARQRLLVARAEADGIRIGARREVKERRTEVLSALREVRQRTAAMLGEQAKEHAERWAAAERIAKEQVAAMDAHYAERVARAEAALAEAEQACADAELSDRRLQEEAAERAAEVLAEARVREERIARDTERVLREHGETWDDVRAHMDNVQSSLAALTGRAAAE
ncbi:cellulose-binding protein [Streptomyces sp. NPDC005492]|uniref:cellulose-binding protein n=1 Tax=Streptomyces sp. NPDC005492 TaxID=3156883 RepID=UPI0033BADCD1